MRRLEQPERITLALPKGRLYDQVAEYLAARGMRLDFEERRLVAADESERLTVILVKNSDLPTYVSHGIAGLGICGEDIIYESGFEFLRLLELPFGGTRMCLAGKAGEATSDPHPRIATKFPRFTRDLFHRRGLPVEVIKLNGSVELAPVLGLAPFIVDLAETGSTLKAHRLSVIETLKDIRVCLIANPAYYKVQYKLVDAFVAAIKR